MPIGQQLGGPVVTTTGIKAIIGAHPLNMFGRTLRASSLPRRRFEFALKASPTLGGLLETLIDFHDLGFGAEVTMGFFIIFSDNTKRVEDIGDIGGFDLIEPKESGIEFGAEDKAAFWVPAEGGCFEA